MEDPFSLLEWEIQRNLLTMLLYCSQEAMLFLLGIIFKGMMKVGKEESGRGKNK